MAIKLEMNKEKIKEFESLYYNLKLSHHNFKRMLTYLNWCFEELILMVNQY